MCGASLFYILIAILVFPLYCVEFYVFTEMELSNSVVNVSILEVVNRSNPATCWRSCHRNPLCSAYFESELRNECRLVSSNASEQQIEGGAGWKYVGIYYDKSFLILVNISRMKYALYHIFLIKERNKKVLMQKWVMFNLLYCFGGIFESSRLKSGKLLTNNHPQ